MRVAIELTLDKALACEIPGEMASYRGVINDCSGHDPFGSIGLAIASAITGTQTSRPILCLAIAIEHLRESLGDNPEDSADKALIDAAVSLIDFYEKYDDELQEQADILTKKAGLVGSRMVVVGGKHLIQDTVAD